MASSRQYLDFVLQQLSLLDEITFRPMMGEFLIYYKGKLVGGVYDNRLLLKPTKSALALLQNPPFEKPYDGAKDMLLVENLDDKPLLAGLIKAVYAGLPLNK